jgi:hypothetical protein
MNPEPSPRRLSGPMPPLEIIECSAVPRVQLAIVLRVDSGADPAAIVFSAIRFSSALISADPKLRLVVDRARSSKVGNDIGLYFTPARVGVETAERLEKVAAVAREAVAAFEGATLVRAEVVPQT